MSAEDLAQSLEGTIKARAAGIEAARRLPEDLSRTFAQAGFYRMAVPRAAGGLELEPARTMRVIEVLARADASAAWCVMIGATSGLALAYLEPATARAIHASPETVLCGVFAPMGRAREDGDHYVVDGRWQWASNSVNSDWMWGGSLVLDVDGKPRLLANGAPDTRLMLMPAAGVTRIDSWHVSGLCGTGSGEIEVKGLRVPKAHTLSLVADKPKASGTLYAFPQFGFLALGVAAVMLGNAGGCVQELAALARAKRPQASARALAERATVQAAFATATAELEAARAWFYRCIDDAWHSAAKGGEMAIEVRAALRLAATHAARTAARVVHSMHDLGGGSSVFLASPLQRRLRDAHVGTQHLMVSPQIYELTGRILLAQPADTSFL